jgi:hypothetical protein
MLSSMLLRLLLAVTPQPGLPHSEAAKAATHDAPNYTSDGQLKMPEHYREWIFSQLWRGHELLPQRRNGRPFHVRQRLRQPVRLPLLSADWHLARQDNPGVEIRRAEGPGFINKRGLSQSPEIMGMEIHVKDAELDGGWGFFEFVTLNSAKLIKRPASCYECHESHAAVDTTFVQFYPTLLGLSKAKGTLSAAYLKEMASPTTK